MLPFSVFGSSTLMYWVVVPPSDTAARTEGESLNAHFDLMRDECDR